MEYNAEVTRMPVNSFENYPMSWKPDGRTLRRPIYQSLADLLEAEILQGALPAGTQLPPQRELADFLDINFTTVTRAYRLCELKGLIHAVTGRGTFVSQHAAQPVTISTVLEESRPLIDLGFVASFERCNRMIAETVRSVSEQRDLERLLDYEHPSGMKSHKEAGLSWMKRFGVEADESRVAIVSGTQNGLALVLPALFSPGDRIAVDVFTYANFKELARLFRIHLVPIPGDGQGMRSDLLDAQCLQKPLHGIFLMPSCSNPTTACMPENRKRELAEVIRRHGLILIEDDIHAFLTAGVVSEYRGPLSRLLPDQSVYLSGTSKSICSGLRVGYLVFGEPLGKPILRALYNMNVKTSSLDAEIISELIRNGDAERIMREKRRLAEQANRIFDEIFPDRAPKGHPVPFYRWLPVTGGKSGIRMEHLLQNAGLRVYHSDRFLCGSGQEQRFLRVSLATARSPEELGVGLRMLREALSGDLG